MFLNPLPIITKFSLLLSVNKEYEGYEEYALGIRAWGTRFLFKKKAAKKTAVLNLEKNYGILPAASVYRQPPKGRRLT